MAEVVPERLCTLDHGHHGAMISSLSGNLNHKMCKNSDVICKLCSFIEYISFSIEFNFSR